MKELHGTVFQTYVNHTYATLITKNSTETERCHAMQRQSNLRNPMEHLPLTVTCV